MVVPYVDPNAVHVPTTGAVIPAAWGTAVRNGLEALVDPPACSVFNSAGIVVASGAGFTTMLANSEDFDNDAMHSTVSNTDRITAQTAGRYLFTANMSWTAGLVGYRTVHFLLNGTTSFGEVQVPPALGGAGTSICTTAPRTLAVADFVTVEGRHLQGANLTQTLLNFSCSKLTR